MATDTDREHERAMEGLDDGVLTAMVDGSTVLLPHILIQPLEKSTMGKELVRMLRLNNRLERLIVRKDPTNIMTSYMRKWLEGYFKTIRALAMAHLPLSMSVFTTIEIYLTILDAGKEV